MWLIMTVENLIDLLNIYIQRPYTVGKVTEDSIVNQSLEIRKSCLGECVEIKFVTDQIITSNLGEHKEEIDALFKKVYDAVLKEQEHRIIEYINYYYNRGKKYEDLDGYSNNISIS